MERALATCVPPAPPGASPQPSPSSNTAIARRVEGSNADAAAEPLSAATSLSSHAAHGRLSADGDEPATTTAAAAVAVASGEGEPSSLREGNGVRAGGGGDKAQGGRSAAADPHPPPPSPPPPPPPNPYVAADAQGGSADYMDFVRVRSLVSRKAAPCFKPRTFLRFPRDVRGRISSRLFFKHVYESVTLQKTRLTLQ